MMRFRLHPSGLTLHRYAERTLGSTPSLLVRRHLASCPDCRASVSFTRALPDALANLPATIPLDSTLLARVIQERAAGQRAILPTTRSTRAANRWRKRSTGLATGFAAAAVIAGVIISHSGSSTRNTSPAHVVAHQSSSAPADEFAVSEFFLPRSAFATEVARADSSAPPLTIDGSRLEAGVFRYARFERTPGGARRQIGRESVELSLARVEGHDAWRVIQRRQIADTEHVETLYAERATLRPLGRTIRVHPYTHYAGITVRQRLVEDSLTGWMQTDSGLGRPIARHLSAALAPYLSDALSPVLLGAVSVGPRWRGRFSILGWAVRDGDVSFPARLRVVGDERVTVPAGTFECWKLAVDASVGMQTYWVRKSDGIGVRSLLESNDVSRELVLTR
jgi:hypothetical protein